MGNRLTQDEERKSMNDVQIQPDGSSEETLGVWGDVMTQGKADTRQRETREDERTDRQGWRVGDRVRVTSDTKPFKGATGIVRAVERDGRHPWSGCGFLFAVQVPEQREAQNQ
jgi:hypothetical protein